MMRYLDSYGAELMGRFFFVVKYFIRIFGQAVSVNCSVLIFVIYIRKTHPCRNFLENNRGLVPQN